MSTQTVPVKSTTECTMRIDEPSVSQIIARGRKQPARAAALGAWLCSAAFASLIWACNMPIDWSPPAWLAISPLLFTAFYTLSVLSVGPVGWIALVPLVFLVRIPQRTRKMYTAIYVMGFLSYVATLEWMRYGDKTMYTAWIATAVYLAMYYPAFVAITRVAVHRLRLPLTLAVPVVWVGLDLLRAHFITGCSWYCLAHTQYRWTTMIQVSDVVGAYGVTFVLAMMSACVAGLVPESLIDSLKMVLPEHRAARQGAEHVSQNGQRRPAISVAVSLSVVCAVLVYGYVRRTQADFAQGPRVALVQGNFISSVKHDPREWRRILNVHRDLTGEAVRFQPDVIVWPETMFPWLLYTMKTELTDEQLVAIAPVDNNMEAWVTNFRDPLVKETLNDRASEAGAAMIVGIATIEADADRFRQYNSAVLVHPQAGVTARYDKIHRVIFGEYVPLKDVLPFLQMLTPFSSHFGIEAGAAPVVLQHQQYRYAPLICFEDTVPHLVRNMVRTSAASGSEGKTADCLVNLTNDGWFHGSRELDQHLITSLFRAVECRKPLVRAVNTGISAFIDGDGVILEPEVYIDADNREKGSMRDPQTGGWRKSLNAVLVNAVPLDNRSSLYVAYGDWFAGLCAAITAVAAVFGIVPRRSGDTQPETGLPVPQGGAQS